MTSFLRATLAVAVLLTSLGALAEVSDSDRATARALAEEAQKALDQKDWAIALDRFTRANALVRAPTLKLGAAEAQVGLGQLIAAQETYNRIIREGVPPGSPDVWREALEDAKREVAKIEPRLAWVTIRVLGPSEPTVALDGKTVPAAALDVRRPANPGKHVISATGPGYERAEKTIELAEGGEALVELSPARSAEGPTEPAPRESTPGEEPAPLEPEKPSGGGTQRLLGYIALGVGGAGLALGSVYGMIAIGKKSELDDQCPAGACPSDEQGLLDDYRSAGTVSTVGFVVGAVVVGAGLTLILTAPSDPAKEAGVRPFVGLGVVGALGRF